MSAENNTPGTRGWSRLHDRTLAVKSRKTPENIFLVMPKYGGIQSFSLGSFPEVGEKQKT